MLSKSATMMLGLINKQPQNAYEIIKVLECMNVKWWYDIANSTVYACFKREICSLGSKKSRKNAAIENILVSNSKDSIDFIKAYLSSFTHCNS